MSRAMEHEFSLLRAAAAKLPEGSAGYEQAREVLAGVRTITQAAAVFTHHDALLLVRTGREKLEKLVRDGGGK